MISAINLFFLGSQTPFSLRFLSDHFEVTGDKLEANNPGKGAKLTYILQNCGA
jgi:hypothetical protein